MSIVKSFSVGDGDTYYIRPGSDNFTVIDCNIDESNQESIINEIKEQSKTKKYIDLFQLIQMKIIYMV